MCRFVPVRSLQTRASGREFVHVCFGLLAPLVQVGANSDGFRALRISPKFLETEDFAWTSARDVRAKMLVFFPGFGGPGRSFFAGCPQGHPGLFWSFGASRAGRCEFGRVWSPLTS